MVILVIYSTTEEQSQKVATRVAKQVRDAGAMVELTAVERATLESFSRGPDAIIIVASLRGGRHAPAVVRWVEAHAQRLNQVPSALVTVSLRAEESPIQDLIDQTGWKPTIRTTIGGALAYSKYGFVKRLLVKHIAKQYGLPTDTSRDYEFTDWSAVRETTSALLAAMH